MAIEYFVEGKTTFQTEGDNLSLSKNEIKNNTLTNVNQKGNTTGTSYNSPKDIHQNDTPINIIDVSLNLFFDGTQNNKTNTQLGKNYEKSNNTDDSYTNDFSNVARGYDAIDSAADNQVSCYIEGIGTEDGESETMIWGTLPNNRGIPLGTGPTGITAKVTKGCIKGAQSLKAYAGKEINLKINVIGFSRGSAAARHFVHIATNSAKIIEGSEGIFALSPFDEDPIKDAAKIPQRDTLTDTNGYFGACLLSQNIKPNKITFNFIGLYDTVASYGINHRGGYAIKGDTEQLGLNSISKANFTLQIASDDEYRDNFDLTNINSTTVRGLQFTLPGVHSDIGGCYVNKDKNKKAIYKELGKDDNCKIFRDILIEEGWYKPHELIIVKKIHKDSPSLYRDRVLIGTKYPFNTYDRIPLNTMFHYSKQFEIKYDESIVKNHEIKDTFLSKISQQLNNYMTACTNLRNSHVPEFNETNSSGNYLQTLKKIHYTDFLEIDDLKELRREYLHWSSDVLATGLSPIIETVSYSEDRKRHIQPG